MVWKYIAELKNTVMPVCPMFDRRSIHALRPGPFANPRTDMTFREVRPETPIRVGPALVPLTNSPDRRAARRRRLTIAFPVNGTVRPIRKFGVLIRAVQKDRCEVGEGMGSLD